MEDLAGSLREKIRGKAAFVGVGNPLRADDGFGPALIGALKGKIDAELFDCGTAPENFLGPLSRVSARTVVFVDAADMGVPPGQFGLYDMEAIADCGFTTHSASLSLLTGLLKSENEQLRFCFLLIQPKDLSFREGLSPEIRRGIELLQGVLGELFPISAKP